MHSRGETLYVIELPFSAALVTQSAAPRAAFVGQITSRPLGPFGSDGAI
jgi:hypothetical protein